MLRPLTTLMIHKNLTKLKEKTVVKTVHSFEIFCYKPMKNVENNRRMNVTSILAIYRSNKLNVFKLTIFAVSTALINSTKDDRTFTQLYSNYNVTKNLTQNLLLGNLNLFGQNL